MRIGAVFPQLEIGDDPAGVRGWAVSVEEMGYRHILAYDHVLGAGTSGRPGWRGYTSEDSFHEVFVLFGHLAAVTAQVELVTGVLVLPQRQTALAAKQAAEVDVLSGGRMRLGVGIGWNPVEYEALGVPFRRRGARVEEQVAVLRALWSRPTTTFHGDFHTIEDAGIKPRPVRGSIPIWFGGTADAMLERAGRIGDGWLPQRAPDETARAMVARVRDAAAAAGRPADAVGLEPRLTLAEVPEDRWAEFADDWRGLGATHLCVNTMNLGLGGPDEHVALLRHVLRVIG